MEEKKKDDQDKKDSVMNTGEDFRETWSLLNEQAGGKDNLTDDFQKQEKKQAKMVRCPHCDEANEANREFCWACYSPLHEPLGQRDKGVVIRKSYLFIPDEHGVPAATEEKLPDNHKTDVDIDYSREVEHSDRIPTRTGEEVIKIPARDIRIFKGSHLIAVRIDGKNYTSEDANVPVEAKMIIRRVQAGEPVQKILHEIKQESPAGTGNPGVYRSSLSGKKNIFHSFFENFSALIIIGLILILLFQLLLILKDCG